MKSNNKILKALDIIIPAICIVAALSAAIYIFVVKKQYSAAENQYKEIEQIAGITEHPKDMNIVKNGEVGKDTDADEKDPYEETFLNLNIDFEALEEINPDVVGWLYIPILDLSYPVVQGTDNEYYLNHIYDGDANFSGSIMLDCENNPDMTDHNTFIYGHHMKNKTMFGILSNILKNPDLIDDDPYIYYYTRDHAYKYRMFSTFVTTTNSFVYLMSDNRDQLNAYLEKTDMVNLYKKEENRKMYPNSVKNIITLSTCNGTHTDRRTIVQAYLNDDYLIPAF